MLSSNGAPAYDLSALSNTAQFIPNTAPLTSAIGDESRLPGTLSVLGPCDVSASCASVLIEPLETLGSELIDQSQKMTAAAMQIAEK